MDRIEKYYSDLALEFKNELIINRCLSTVHLEAEADKMFWDTMLQAYKPGTYNYKYQSKNIEGKTTGGCQQCLKFKKFLDSRFFICIDSDHILLPMQETWNASQYIMQTYCYSWENHYCFADKLQEDFAESCPDAAAGFDFRIFLKNYSIAIYDYYLQFLYLGHTGDLAKCSKSKFNGLVVTQYKSGDEIDNGAPVVNRVKMQLDEYFSKLDVSAFDKNLEKKRFEDRGLTDSNVYLYLRGHNLEHLIMSIGTHLCKGFNVDFKNDILYKSPHLDAYPEIRSIKADLLSF